MFNKDSAPPETLDEEKLSRVRDMLMAAHEVKLGIDGFDSHGSKVWKSLPEIARMEFNYSRWTYRSK